LVFHLVSGVCAFFFFSSRRRHTRSKRDWSSDVCSSDLDPPFIWFYELYISANHTNYTSLLISANETAFVEIQRGCYYNYLRSDHLVKHLLLRFILYN